MIYCDVVRESKQRGGFSFVHGPKALRCLVPFLVVFSVSLGHTAQAAELSSSVTAVSASIAPTLEVTQWPSALVAISTPLTPGVPVVEGPLTFNLRTNAPWVLQVKSSMQRGYLSEYDTSTWTYVPSGAQMTSPVAWGLSGSGPWTVLTESDTDVTTGPATGSAGSTVNLYLKAVANFDDPLLTGPNREYRLDMGYTVSLTY